MNVWCELLMSNALAVSKIPSFLHRVVSSCVVIAVMDQPWDLCWLYRPSFLRRTQWPLWVIRSLAYDCHAIFVEVYTDRFCHILQRFLNSSQIRPHLNTSSFVQPITPLRFGTLYFTRFFIASCAYLTTICLLYTSRCV